MEWDKGEEKNGTTVIAQSINILKKKDIDSDLQASQFQEIS